MTSAASATASTFGRPEIAGRQRDADELGDEGQRVQDEQVDDAERAPELAEPLQDQPGVPDAGHRAEAQHHLLVHVQHRDQQQQRPQQPGAVVLARPGRRWRTRPRRCRPPSRSGRGRRSPAVSSACAVRLRRAATSSSRIVPSAPRMSPTCSAVEDRAAVFDRHRHDQPSSPYARVMGKGMRASVCAVPGSSGRAGKRQSGQVTACRGKNARTTGCGAIDGPDYCNPYLASSRPGHTRVPASGGTAPPHDTSGEKSGHQRPGAPLLVRALARHDVAPLAQPLRVTP